MINEITEDIYSLDELIQRLEDIRQEKSTGLNFPKAFYSLALEIKSIKEKLEEKKSDEQ